MSAGDIEALLNFEQDGFGNLVAGLGSDVKISLTDDGSWLLESTSDFDTWLSTGRDGRIVNHETGQWADMWVLLEKLSVLPLGTFVTIDWQEMEK